jgi:hypothetical protein
MEWFGPDGKPLEPRQAPERDEPSALDPIFLPDDIVSKAKEWQDVSLANWERGQPGALFQIGEAVFTSPVDQQERPVVLCLAPWSSDRPDQRTARGVTFAPGADFAAGVVTSDPVRYRVVLNTAFSPRGDLLLLVLHELTHVVDPCFLEDCEIRKTDPGRWGSAEQYSLRSERRAFVSMWTEAVREAIVGNSYSDPESFVSGLAGRCPEFDHFYVDSIVRGPKWSGQVREHIAFLAAQLGSARQGGESPMS